MARLRLTPWKTAGFLAGLAAFAALYRADEALGARPAAAAAVTALMAVWWITEALPIHVTALAPLALFPATGVLAPGPLDGLVAAARPYADPYIFLFAGGMCIGAAMQQWDLHRRIALAIMRAIGTDARRLLLGVLAATAFISLWISNTATAAMMLPIGMAVVAQCEARAGGRRLAGFGGAIMLAVAYGANIGGIGTKIGTAPNAQLAGFLAQDDIEISFLDFAAIGLPFVALFLPVAWLGLWASARADAPRGEIGAAALAEESARLGAVKRGERLVLGIFLVTAALWAAAQPLTAALRALAPEIRSAHVEGGAAVLAAVALLVLRADGRRALEVRRLRSVPWETLLLLGGSFSMALGVKESGLSDRLAAGLAFLRDLDPFPQVLAASAATVALSAFASNTATTAIMLGVLREAVSRSHLTTVLFAATISASCDFALPAGTPPNAIVFGSGYVTVPRMAKTGVLLDLAAAVVAAAWCFAVVRLVV